MNIRVRLDSSRSDATGDRWRQPCGEALRILHCSPGGIATLLDGPAISLKFPEPLDALAWLGRQRRAGHRWIGYLSYDLNRYFEPAVGTCHPTDLPLFIFSEHRLGGELPPLRDDARPLESHYVGANFTREQYLSAVSRAIDYIGAGDIFQVNLAQQLLLETESTPNQIYARIQSRYPAWYAALLDYGSFALISNSPELYLRSWREGERTLIETRPIKGTRPRRPSMREELLASIKDQAELNMIVDLERNDLGRVCAIGSVRVLQMREIEEHPTVYHGSATVVGELATGVGFLDVLKATFPGGSITGAPKIRAMQIIHELEPDPRGAYCGAIGYLDADGAFQFNIAIRTMIKRGMQVHVPVGGGIVADSQPIGEYEETLVKARAALAALGVEESAREG